MSSILEASFIQKVTSAQTGTRAGFNSLLHNFLKFAGYMDVISLDIRIPVHFKQCNEYFAIDKSIDKIHKEEISVIKNELFKTIAKATQFSYFGFPFKFSITDLDDCDSYLYGSDDEDSEQEDDDRSGNDRADNDRAVDDHADDVQVNDDQLDDGNDHNNVVEIDVADRHSFASDDDVFSSM